jgi:hypothetical protein
MSDAAVRLEVLVEANTKQMANAMAKLEKTVAQTVNASTRSVKSLDSQMAAMGATALRAANAFGVAFSSRALVGFVKDTLDAAAAISDTAKRIGVTTDQLQELRVAGEHARVSFSDVDQALEHFAKSIGDAAAGSGEFLPVLEAHGIALRDVNGALRPVNDLLNDYADVLKNAGSEQERLSLASRAFGEGNVRFAAAVRDGSVALNEQRQAAHNAGRVIKEELIDRGKDLSTRWGEFTGTLTSAFQTFVLSVADGTATVMQKIADMRGAMQTDHDKQRNVLLQQTLDELQRRVDASKSAAPSTSTTAAPAAAAATGPTIAQLEAGKDKLREGLEALALEEKRVAGIQAVVDTLRFQEAQLGRTDRAQAEYNALVQAGIDKNDAMAPAVIAAADALYDHEQAFKASKDAAAEAAAAAAKFNDAMLGIADQGFDVFSGIITGAKDAKSAILDFLEQLVMAEAKAAFLHALNPSSPTGPIMHALGFAEGGQIRGAGSRTSDSIPAFLSNGEFVVNAAAASRHLGLLHSINRGAPMSEAAEEMMVPGPKGRNV